MHIVAFHDMDSSKDKAGVIWSFVLQDFTDFEIFKFFRI